MSIIEQLQRRQETLWINPDWQHIEPRSKVDGYGFIQIKAAQNRMMRFTHYIRKAFPETEARAHVL